MASRRDFLRKSFAAASSGLLLQSLSSCQFTTHSIKGQIVGANASMGHRLRTPSLSNPAITSRHDVVIIGGGIAGLSAARQLQKKSVDFVLLELDEHAGGNSISGENPVSRYPWGAHYLPLPNLSNKPLLEFLQEVNVITHFKNELPVFNELYLCFDPKERLYINEHWQEGLIPHNGVPAKDQDEITRFLAMMDDFRNKVGRDQRFAFTIPVAESSSDFAFRKLDLISMETWLLENNFRSSYLRWYVNYCCRDDFGAAATNTSAWAGIHYFASRKGKGYQVASDTVLTWPQGNGWLVDQLKQPVKEKIQTGCLVTSVELNNQQVKISYFNQSKNEYESILANQVVMATPQFVNQYLIKSARTLTTADFHYAPWMVANLTVTGNLNEKRGEALAWDNVIYQGDSLGYVHANHQQLHQSLEKQVLTYYRPLVELPYRDTRKKYQAYTWQNWVDSIVTDLKRPHPLIENSIEEAQVWIWGHGMISPPPHFIFGGSRVAAQQSIQNKILFAHSDLSGISIFEEAFYWGNLAAQQVLQTV